MKFEVMERNVTTVGALSTKDITLSANAKAFKIIFGQMYPDIIKAIVRELFTNAWDSQKVAGTLETPIDIHLPTTFEPWFSIRDFGTGMTQQVIDDIYSNVFESSKDDSQEEAGMFGMGSKTPLGYTDSFTVTSFVDGKLYAYDMILASSGKPQIILKVIEDTDELNGVEVSLGVKMEDFDKFKEYTELFALGAGTPISINRERFLNKRNVVMSGTDWELEELVVDYYNRKPSYIRMGCVLYKIDSQMVTAGMDYYESNKIKSILNHPFTFNFDIGEFDVTGSREDIIYTNQSIQKIKERIDFVVDEIAENIQEKINSHDNLNEAIHFFSKSIWDIDRNLIPNNVMTGLKYKSIKLLSYMNLVEKVATKAGASVLKYSRSGEITLSPGNIHSGGIFDPTTKLYVVMGDKITKRVLSRIKNLNSVLHQSMCRQGGIRKTTHTPDKKYSIIYIQPNADSKLRNLLAFAPKHYYMIDIADINPLPPVRREKNKVEKIDKAYSIIFNKKRGAYTVNYTQDKLVEDAYYIPLVDNRRLNHRNYPMDLHVALSILKINLSTDCVFGLSPAKMGFVEKYNLINLFDAAEEERNKIDYNDHSYYHHVMTKLYKDDITGHVWISNTSSNHIATILDIERVDKDQVDQTFNPDVNETVAKRFETLYNEFHNKLIELYTRHPVLTYISQYSITYNGSEILKALGETK